jgi:hypothetical protein
MQTKIALFAQISHKNNFLKLHFKASGVGLNGIKGLRTLVEAYSSTGTP